MQVTETPRPTNRSPPLTTAFLYSPPYNSIDVAKTQINRGERACALSIGFQPMQTPLMGLRGVTPALVSPRSFRLYARNTSAQCTSCQPAARDGCVCNATAKKKEKKKARQASAMASSRIRDYSGVGFGFHERCEDTMEAHRGLRRIIYTPRRLARGRKKIISGALGCRNQARRRRCA